MAEISNKARVGDAFDLLAQGLEPFVDFHMSKTVPKGGDWAAEFVRTSKNASVDYSTSDPSFLLRVIADCWRGTFERQLPRSTRNLVFSLRDKRNEWAHNKPVKLNDALFILSGIVTLLELIDAKEVDKVRLSLDELNRAQYERGRDTETASSANVVDVPKAGLPAWREVIHPHPDVTSGAFAVAEFAADLELVRKGGGSAEYSDPYMFFERTYLTTGLRDLLRLGLQRVCGGAGQPVINCQTNFGGGKTHSLIALYHLLSGIDLARLPEDLRDLVASLELDELPTVNRAVVVGNRFAAGEVAEKHDGTKVNTIWGELAWQLGGREAYDIIAESDRNRTNPGDRLREVIERYSPCLILIDEWVAYARELYGRDDLPAGSFDTQFGFAQTLTEVVKATPGALFVVSIPASEGSSTVDDDSISDIEVGGAAGRAALQRLTAAVTRVAAQWQPASGDESYEIVRRRLFQPLETDGEPKKNAVAEAFGELYRANRADFPQECGEIDYVDRIKTAYPIHPEVFDRLYQDWSTVERFQRTRGVLRLMAATIHSLWESDDQSPLILPCSIPLVDIRVANELAGKLPDYWSPVLDAEVDGPQSIARAIDRQVPAIGSMHGTRRVARTIFVAATPTVGSANKGVEVSRIRLGSVFAGERPGFVTDALARLGQQAHHLYQDRDRYWFDRQQNVTRRARDEAARLLQGSKQEIRAEIERRLASERASGDFARVHVCPSSPGEVADENVCRLVVLRPDQPHIARAEQSDALAVARSILDERGSGARQYRNMLIFAAADQRAMEGLETAVADYLAWSDICDRIDELNLDAQKVGQAKNRRQQADGAVGLRLGETYQYAIVPYQNDPLGPVEFEEVKLDGQEPLAQRVSRKLVNEGSMQTRFPPVMLRLRLDNELASRWEEGDVTVSTLWEDFARYVYLPRLRDVDVLVQTVASGPNSVAWETEGFAVAVGYDESQDRFLDLTAGASPGYVSATSHLVRPDFALGQIEAERQRPGDDDDRAQTDTDGDSFSGAEGTPAESANKVTTFTGTVRLNTDRPTKEFHQISTEVLEHFIAQAGTDVDIVVRVVATRDEGFDDATIRTVTENANTLKFEQGSGFEE